MVFVSLFKIDIVCIRNSFLELVGEMVPRKLPSVDF